MALSGKQAKVKITAAAGTGSTGEAMTKNSSGVYQITDSDKKHWDRDTPPTVYVNSTVAASSKYDVN